jgi:hypothetical protein
MRLTVPDRNEFLKAALKTTDLDIKEWIVRMVDAMDNLPEGKSDVPVPPYRPASGPAPAPAPALGNGHAAAVPQRWEDNLLT